MGGSDLVRIHYSYDDLPAGQTDPTLASFSIAHDLADIVPLIKQARALNPQLVVMATPWSPPGWMKTSGSLIGGALLASAHALFANYFVKYIQAYDAAGIPIDYVSLQNEPLYVPGDYPGMSMDATTQLAVLKLHLLPALTSAGLSTKALVYDHNWDRPITPTPCWRIRPSPTVSSSVSGVSGVRDVYLIFDGTTSIGNVNWLRVR